VLDLYAGEFDGQPLEPDEFVLSADEKTSIQARVRRHPTVPANHHHPMLVEHEYIRAGSLAYLAAWDVHRAALFGFLAPTTGTEPFGRLVDQVMGQEPYRSARRVFWVIDNGSSHRGARSVQRLESAYSNLRLVHLPLHASWLNQIEIYFSILQRKVLTPANTSSIEQLSDAILGFQARYQMMAKPFEWKFTRTDLAKLLDRLSSQDNCSQVAA
jgi:transposase